MHQQHVACNRDLLTRLLADDLTPAEEQAVAAHLSSCADCQSSLEQLAADRPVWNELREHVAVDALPSRSPTPDGEARDAWVEDFLHLLDATDDPQMLGRLGCFEVRGIIGRGSTGIVLKAFEPRLNRFVAIKVLSPALAANGAARQRFEREGQAIAAVSHQHVVPIYAVAEHRGLPFIVMQYVPAGTLQQRIDRDGPLTTEEILRGAMQIAAGLAAAHAQGIIHRDIKPANVLLDSDVNRVLVTDFGLARIVHDVAMTQSGVVAGTPQYMSPEQARGEGIDHRSDLFGLGSVMYAMCTGHPPFRAETVFGIIKRVCESPARPIRELNPAIPDWLAAFVNKLMAKDADARFESAAQVASLLSHELAALQNPAAHHALDRSWMPAPAPAPHRRAAWPSWTAVPIGVLIGAAILISNGGVLGFKQALRDRFGGQRAAAPGPERPHDHVTAVEDRDQMMAQLGVVLPDALVSPHDDPRRPPGAQPDDANDPMGNWSDDEGNVIVRSGFGLWVNYDDRYVGDYTPIDLLRRRDGKRITTAKEWWTKRRPEVLDDVQECLWGRIPDAKRLPGVSWAVGRTLTGESSGAPFAQQELLGEIDVARYPQVRHVPKLEATLRLPANAAGPVPVIIALGDDFVLQRVWQYAGREGWGVCALNTAALQPDDGGTLTSYLIGLVNKGRWRQPDDWGVLVAWSWGVSRLVDRLESDPAVDGKKIGVFGHARFGKAAIVGMAYDQRLAICYPSCSGVGGVEMLRRHYGQELENAAWDREYQWMAGNIFQWMGPLHEGQYKPRKLELLPVDAHALVALAAPRPVFVGAGTMNTWSDPYGSYLATAGATPVYELLGKRGLVMPDDKPQPDVAYIEGDLAYRLHHGGHEPEPDWPAFVEFARRYLNSSAAGSSAAEGGTDR